MQRTRRAAPTRANVIVGNVEEAERARLTGLAREAGCEVRAYARGAEILETVSGAENYILFLSTHLEDMLAGELLAMLGKRYLQIVTVVIVPPMAIMAAVDAIRAGASDVQEHPLGKQRFLQSLHNALSLQQSVETPH